MTKNINSVKILVIDNDAAIRRSFTDYLEDRGFEQQILMNFCKSHDVSHQNTVKKKGQQ